MRWDEDHESPDVIDRRGEPAAGGGGGGLFWLLPFLLRSPLGWVILLVILAVSAFGAIRRGFYGGGDGAQTGTPNAPGDLRHTESPMVHFVSFVLDDAQAAWTRELGARGVMYRKTKLVLFTDSTDTACGYGRAATGPFYCPRDERVYIDLGFYRELEQRLGARGDFAKAYVIAHEIGHHVQKILGTSERRAAHTQGADQGSVRLELQADCYAGIWAHSTAQRDLLERGDVESALNAAAAIGDDRLQRRATGTVSPETWTHGSSDQRVRWFRRGFDGGKIESCDTFAAPSL